MSELTSRNCEPIVGASAQVATNAGSGLMADPKLDHATSKPGPETVKAEAGREENRGDDCARHNHCPGGHPRTVGNLSRWVNHRHELEAGNGATDSISDLVADPIIADGDDSPMDIVTADDVGQPKLVPQHPVSKATVPHRLEGVNDTCDSELILPFDSVDDDARMAGRSDY